MTNEEVNAFLDQLAVEGTLEPMAEPIDDSTCHPLDWAEVVGIVDEVFDEIYPEAKMKTMVNEDGPYYD